MNRKWLTTLSVLVILVTFMGTNVIPAMAQAYYINYTVQRGDTLGKIAYDYCTDWREIYNLNRDTIGKDPNVIKTGMVLLIPAYCGAAVQLPGGTEPVAGTVIDSGPIARATGTYLAPYYTIAWGDSLFSIGLRFGIPWQEIANANGISGTTIFANRSLLIPGGEFVTNLPSDQVAFERVNFQKGASSTTLVGYIDQGSPKGYIVWARGGQTITVRTVSHGEPLVVSIGNTRGDLLPVVGRNSQIKNKISVTLPETGDFIITVRPVSGTESPLLAFDISITIE
jgi:LysM repeat protein